ncbi:hypothetical protein PTTG_25789 [Puccinia triticina 1-1 BBBD Race 1]|uniref:Uncharacterized protein n=2 Tax=Puccinia triticina TaxID=208348 RepID=A0A180H0F4_PUCT1|nr:uncharacterized protein PtA15_10A441 [Puccinia triticina]OAV98068.1 hypothetical protein PTTG_25789 [Puccinia triticina 1-1 BBBD Race 1]WAQ89018.1 hypothetical protein PtA15_10A441 [Puccinia triticina]WAR59078.1 hypothetical protein PtB15_10B420 [Puccinia triticina]
MAWLQRLEAIRFYAGPSLKNKRISQWSIIDNQLEFLRRQEPIYQQAFFGLMVEKDSELFGSGQAYFRDLETNVDWEMPIDNNALNTSTNPHNPAPNLNICISHPCFSLLTHQVLPFLWVHLLGLPIARASGGGSSPPFYFLPDLSFLL